jgi:hypothetical protein
VSNKKQARDDTGKRNLVILDFLAPFALPIGVPVVFPPLQV